MTTRHQTEIIRPCGCVALTEPGFNQTPVIMSFQPGPKCWKGIARPPIKDVRQHFNLEVIR